MKPATPTTVATLLVDSNGSEKLALAANEGRIMLTLRSWTDEQQIATNGIKPSALLSDNSVAPAPTPAPSSHHSSHHQSSPPPPPTLIQAVAPAPARKEVVEILRGDRFEERKFDAKDKTEELKQ